MRFTLHFIFYFESNQALTISSCMHIFQPMERQMLFHDSYNTNKKACMMVVQLMSIRFTVITSAAWTNDFPVERSGEEEWLEPDSQLPLTEQAARVT